MIEEVWRPIPFPNEMCQGYSEGTRRKDRGVSFSWKDSLRLSLVCLEFFEKFSFTDGVKKQRVTLDFFDSHELEKLQMEFEKCLSVGQKGNEKCDEPFMPFAAEKPFKGNFRFWKISSYWKGSGLRGKHINIMHRQISILFGIAILSILKKFLYTISCLSINVCTSGHEV